jgi:hypothetical protein
MLCSQLFRKSTLFPHGLDLLLQPFRLLTTVVQFQFQVKVLFAQFIYVKIHVAHTHGATFAAPRAIHGI